MTTKELEDMQNRALSCFNNALNDSEKLLGGKTDICKKNANSQYLILSLSMFGIYEYSG